MQAPLMIVRASMAALPRLQAEESILAAQRAAIGSGRLTADEAQRTVWRWERAAQGGGLLTSAQAPRSMPHMGLGVRLTPTSDG